MTATVVGIRHVDFEPEGKERIVGDKLHVVKAMNPNDQNIQGLSRSNLPPFLGRFFLVYCITTERLFPPFIFKENAIKTSADTAKSISRGLEGIFYLLFFVAFIFAAFISRFTSSDVSSRHLPCGNMPSFTAPTAVRFSLATSRPSCSHIFRICRFRPS